MGAGEVALLALICAVGAAAMGAGPAPEAPPGFILGADISWVQQQEDEGRRFSDRGVPKDVLETLRDHKFNWIRLRIFHDPTAKNGYSSKGYCDLQHTLQMARRIKAAGMGFLLDFHYSDTWADPKHQRKPAAWTSLGLSDLKQAVRDYTEETIRELKKQGTPPDMVQIGNEINHGILWSDPNVPELKWDAFGELLKAGIAGAREAAPSVKIMLHIACGGQNDQSRWFLDNALARGVTFDVIGQSYYPQWHGTLDDLKRNLTDLASRYEQPIIVVEYSAPNGKPVSDIVRGLPHGKGLGTFIWEPTASNGPALFDRDGNAKLELDIYTEMANDYGKEKR